MVIDKGDIFVGLLVDQVFGISRFVSSHYIPEQISKESPFYPYNHGKFIKDDESYFVFMPSLLIKDANHKNAAIQ